MNTVKGESAEGGMPTNKVLILSEIRLYREVIARLVAEAMERVAVCTASTIETALAQLRQEPVEVMLVDLALPEALEGARTISARFSEVKLVGLGVDDDQLQVVACAEAGITGFVSRSASLHDLLDAIQCVRAGELNCSRRVAGALAERVASLASSSGAASAELPLTPREIQILRLVDEGLTNKEIASRLHISASTARNHVHNILERLGVRTRTRAAAVARRFLS